MQQKPSEELVLKMTKEIVVKFIEMGRITPANFDSTFRSIYQTIQATMQQELADDNS